MSNKEKSMGSQLMLVVICVTVQFSILYLAILRLMMNLLKSPIVNHWSVISLHYNNYIETSDVGDSKIYLTCLQSDWMLATS